MGVEVHILKQVLKDKGIHHHIEGIVYYANTDLEYRVKREDTGVEVMEAAEDGERKMRRFIMQGDEYLSEEEISRITRALGR